uniref:Putative domain transmembrane protein n=1 Tax=uncultured Aquificaceae bacterium TaxID=374108 RepID=A0A146JBU4_9AQUI|nr:putative domain transmembrane protein [uncultured Aquificaceae bacterium]
MGFDLLIQNILNPPILFFLLGLLSVFLRTGLDIPQPLPKFFSLYLLIAIGLHGGYELAKSGIDSYIVKVLLISIFMAVLVPIYAFFILRIKLDIFNAIAIAATYGSISAVTFITATNFLQTLGESFGGYMVAAMTLMESPAIIIGLVLLSLFAKRKENEQLDWKEVFRESLFNPSVYILVGSLIIGYITGEKGWKVVDPLFGQLFKPMLAFFLLDMGIVAARRLGDLKKVGGFLVSFAIFLPIINAIIAILIAHFLSVNKGDAFMLAVLSASASYIAVPAAMRLSVPEANPSIYVTMSLAITFPFNISVGIPIYYWLVNYFWGV